MFPPLRAAFYLATSGAIITGGATILGHGPPRLVSLAMMGTYAGLLALGVTSPATEIFSDAVVRVSRGVALTFDDGPHPEHTRRVMDILEAHKARGTFFMIGHKIEKHPDVAREVLARGHAVGAHGYTHDRLYALRGRPWLERDAEREDALWKQVFGFTPVLFRPPIGLMNPKIAQLCDDHDRIVVAWTIRPRDGLERTNAQTVVRRVTRSLKQGAVVLMHDADELDRRAPTSLQALPDVLTAMRTRELQPVIFAEDGTSIRIRRDPGSATEPNG